MQSFTADVPYTALRIVYLQQTEGARNCMTLCEIITLYWDVWPGNSFLVSEAIQFTSDQVQARKAV
jgi:hypothetical protein